MRRQDFRNIIAYQNYRVKYLMPLLSKIGTFSFDKETWCSATSFAFVKNLLLLINFMSMLAGLILMGTGGYILSSTTQDIIGLASTIGTAAIVIGTIVSIVSFLGCFGAANEKGILLKTYFIFLLLLIILEISVGAAAYARGDQIPEQIKGAWQGAAISPTQNVTILAIERQFQCCGFLDINDYPVPKNCSAVYGYNVGCERALTEALVSSVDSIGATGIVIGLVELVGLIFSVVMFRKISRRENAQASLLNEAWRVNRTKVQYGYQNYQYV